MPTKDEATKLLDNLTNAIGEVVFYCQIFEMLFTFVCKVVLPKGPPVTLKEFTSGRFPEFASKLLKELSKDVDISNEYRQRLGEFIEGRNIVVHRGLKEFTLDLQAYESFAYFLAEEAGGQIAILLDTVLIWAKKKGVSLPDMPPELAAMIQMMEPQVAELIERVRREYPTMLVGSTLKE